MSIDDVDILLSMVAMSRTESGRNELGQNGTLSSMCQSLHSLRTDRNCYMLTIRVLRNACAGNSSNILIVRDNKVVTEVFEYMKSLREAPDGPDYEKEVSNVVTASCQLYANLSNSCADGAKCFWEECGIEGLSHLLAMGVSVKSENAVAAVLATIHACILHDSEEYNLRKTKILSSRQICSQVMLCVMDTEFRTSSSSQKSASSSSASEWLHLLILRLARCDDIVSLLMVLAPSIQSETAVDISCRLTHEQVIAMHSLEGVFRDPIYLKETTRLFAGCNEMDLNSLSESVPPSLRCPRSVVEFLCAALHPLSVQFLRSGILANNTSAVEACRMSHGIPAVLTCWTMLSTALCTIAAFGGPRNVMLNNVKARVTNSGIVHLCIAFLGQYRSLKDAHVKKNPTKGSAGKLDEDTGGIPVGYANELVKTALSLLMNLSHMSSSVQDLVREIDGLPVILAHCATDFDNPLCREYALMCIRNLCEGNIANQEYIDALRPQKVVQDELMQQHGLSVEIDPLSGKVHFKHDEKTQQMRNYVLGEEERRRTGHHHSTHHVGSSEEVVDDKADPK